MSMGEREREKKEESRFERYEDKRWKYSLCRDKIDPHLEVDAKKKRKMDGIGILKAGRTFINKPNAPVCCANCSTSRCNVAFL